MTSKLKMASTLINTLQVLYLISVFGFIGCTNCKGCVQLDSYCFDKIISKFDAALVKFDVAYPYGDKHEAFAKVSESVRDVPQLLVGEVGVKDYGEKDNTDLAARYEVSKDDFPVLMLFKPGVKPIKFQDDFTADNILNFLRKNSEVYVGLPGCIEELDKLASQFAAASDEKERRQILRTTEDKWDGIKGASNQKSAEVYVKTMRKSIEKANFVEGEIIRIDKIMKGKVSKEKSSEMQLRINILKSFLISNKARKEEL